MVIAAFSITALLQWVGDNWQAIIIAIGMVIAAASVLIKALEALVAILVKFFPKLSVLDGELKGIAAWLDALAKSSFLNRAALSPAAPKAPGRPVAPPGGPVGLKSLAILVAAGFCLHSTPSRAEWSVGPSIPLVRVDVGGRTSLAPGAGAMGGYGWKVSGCPLVGSAVDCLHLDGALFGSLFGQTAQVQAAGTVGIFGCFANNLACLGFGVDVASTQGGLFQGFTWKKNTAVLFNVGLESLAELSLGHHFTL